MSLLSNAWVDSYLDALLSSGLSSEWARGAASAAAAARAPGARALPAEADAEAGVAARYYLQQIMALDEGEVTTKGMDGWMDGGGGEGGGRGEKGWRPLHCS